MRLNCQNHLHRTGPAEFLGDAIPAWGATSIQVQFPCDIDNQPTGNFPGPEDIDWNGDGMIDMLVSNGTATASCPATLKYMRLGGTDGYSQDG